MATKALKKRGLRYHFKAESAPKRWHAYLSPNGGELVQKKAKMRRTMRALRKQHGNAEWEMFR